MTLKEKFSALLPFYNVNDNNNKSIQCEKIADDYAIEFYIFMKTIETKIAKGKRITDKELLEIFKKEKGL